MKHASIVFIFTSADDKSAFYAEDLYAPLRKIASFTAVLAPDALALSTALTTYADNFYCKTIVAIGKDLYPKNIASLLKKMALSVDCPSAPLEGSDTISYYRLENATHFFAVPALREALTLVPALSRYDALTEGGTLYALAQRVGALLGQHGLTIATAESCSGGLIVKTLTDVSGASATVRGGACTYTAEAKEHVLGVPPETISTYGIVSEETAAAMATGAARLYDATVTIATTGVAGPGADPDGNPEGRVCIALYINGALTTYDYAARMHTPLLDRNAIRLGCTRFALEHLCELLQEEA